MNDLSWALLEPQLMAAAGAAVVAGLLVLLYLNRRRAYVLFWTLGWVLIAASMVILGGAPDGRLTEYAGLYQTLNVASALAFALSASAMGGPLGWTPRDTFGAIGLGLWLALGSRVFGATGALLPGYLVAGTALGMAAFRYALLARREQFTGAWLMTAGLGVVAISNLWMIRVVTQFAGEVVLQVMALNVVAYSVVTLGMHLLMFEDTTKELRLSNKRLEAAREELRNLALTDPLTGAYNRRFFDEIIGRELERHRRAAQPLAVAFVDIDRFKLVNDVHGHATGDTLLRDVSEFFRRKLRETDYVFRWGGDEFVVLMSCSAADAAKRMHTLKTEYESAPLVTALGNGVGLSIGFAEAAPGTKDADPVIAAADRDMYEKKRLVL